MFLELNHQKLEVFKISQKFVFECYKLTKTFPRMKNLEWYLKSEEQLYLFI